MSKEENDGFYLESHALFVKAKQVFDYRKN